MVKVSVVAVGRKGVLLEDLLQYSYSIVVDECGGVERNECVEDLVR